MVMISQIVQGVNRVYQVSLIVYQGQVKMKMDENEKTARELYQDGIEVMKGLKLPDAIEIKDENLKNI